MERICLDCGNVLKGRADKKFCDDQCRNSYNNKLKMEDSAYVRKVNRILFKNRNLLKEENPNGKTKVRKKILTSKGFDFDYFTNHYVTQKGQRYVFCYEYGYLLLENEEVLLVKKTAGAL